MNWHPTKDLRGYESRPYTVRLTLFGRWHAWRSNFITHPTTHTIPVHVRGARVMVGTFSNPVEAKAACERHQVGHVA